MSPDQLRHSLVHLLDQEYIHSGVKFIAGFAFGVLVKKPFEEWWNDRGQRGQLRKEIYTALADFYAALELYIAMQSDSHYPKAEEEVVQTSCETLDPTKYDSLLWRLHPHRLSMRDEVDGFDRILHLLREIPGPSAPIITKREVLNKLCGTFLQTIVSDFDSKRLDSAIKEQRQLNVRRAVKQFIEPLKQLDEQRSLAFKHLSETEQKIRLISEETDRKIENIAEELRCLEEPTRSAHQPRDDRDAGKEIPPTPELPAKKE